MIPMTPEDSQDTSRPVMFPCRLPAQGHSSPDRKRPNVHNTKADDYALCDGDWLLIDAKSGYTSMKPPPAWNQKHDQPAADGQTVELCHLKDDLQQRHNLAANHPDRVQSLQAHLNRIRDQ